MSLGPSLLLGLTDGDIVESELQVEGKEEVWKENGGELSKGD